VTTVAALDPDRGGVTKLVVAENRVSFLSVPHLPRRLTIWGEGGGAGDILSWLAWLDRVAMTYWGDIDHGLVILDRVCAEAPHARSIPMDLDTLLAYKGFWGTSLCRTSPKSRTCSRLSAPCTSSCAPARRMTARSRAPIAVDGMISATNAGDSEQFLAASARDAVLNDWGRVFEGRDRIAAWNAAENIGVNSKITVTAVTRVEGGHVSLGVNVSGDGYTGPGTFDIEVA
jgi:hypothetical protein